MVLTPARSALVARLGATKHLFRRDKSDDKEESGLSLEAASVSQPLALERQGSTFEQSPESVKPAAERIIAASSETGSADLSVDIAARSEGQTAGTIFDSPSQENAHSLQHMLHGSDSALSSQTEPAQGSVSLHTLDSELQQEATSPPDLADTQARAMPSEPSGLREQGEEVSRGVSNASAAADLQSRLPAALVEEPPSRSEILTSAGLGLSDANQLEGSVGWKPESREDNERLSTTGLTDSPQESSGRNDSDIVGKSEDIGSEPRGSMSASPQLQAEVPSEVVSSAVQTEELLGNNSSQDVK